MNISVIFGKLFQSVLFLSPAAAFVIMLVLLARSVLGTGRDPRIFYCLWVVVAVRLLLPWPSSFLSGWLPGWRQAVTALPGAGFRPSGFEPAHLPVMSSPAESVGFAAGAATVDGMTAACGLWLAGAVGTAIIFAASHWKFRASLRKHAILPGRTGPMLQECLDACRAQLGIRTPVTLKITSLVSSPAVIGLAKPQILIPRQLAERLDRQEWTCIFTHELIHIRRKDLLWNLVMTAAIIVHWFNPLAWKAYRAMREDQELACDAALTKYVDPVQYGRTLTRVAEFQTSPERFAAISFMSGRTNRTTRRMKMLFARKRTWLSLAAAVCLAAVSALIITIPDLKADSAASGPAGSFIAPASGTIVWEYGEPRKHNEHSLAIAADEGTPVYAAADGVVLYAGYDGGNGNRIAIAHGDAYETAYNHLQDITVKEGEQVRRGQQIGTVGSTGRSTGPHLAFELLHNGEPIDPERVIVFDMPRRGS